MSKRGRFTDSNPNVGAIQYLCPIFLTHSLNECSCKRERSHRNLERYSVEDILPPETNNFKQPKHVDVSHFRAGLRRPHRLQNTHSPPPPPHQKIQRKIQSKAMQTPVMLWSVSPVTNLVDSAENFMEIRSQLFEISSTYIQIILVSSLLSRVPVPRVVDI